MEGRVQVCVYCSSFVSSLCVGAFESVGEVRSFARCDASCCVSERRFAVPRAAGSAVCSTKRHLGVSVKEGRGLKKFSW